MATRAQLMTQTRRRFMGTSMALAGIALLPSALIGSCGFRGKRQETLVDYIGTEEGFESYGNYFKRIKGARFNHETLESSLSSESGIVMIDSASATKTAYMIMLLEKGKDILTSYPLGYSLGDFASIAEFMEKYGKLVGLINPLAFYPSLGLLKEINAEDKISLNQVQVNCHPVRLGDDFFVAGSTGTAQLFQRIVSHISDAYPVSIQAKTDTQGRLSLLYIRYEEFMLIVRFDPEQLGWNMKFEGENFVAHTDHTGMLSVNNEVQPRHAPDPAVLYKSIRANLEDFLSAVRKRNDPLVNHLDGLASIVLNNAVDRSLKNSEAVESF